MKETKFQHIDKLIEPTKPVHNKNKIPKVIIQTFETNYLPKRMIKKGCRSWINMNPEYTYIFFDDNDRKEFITKNFSSSVLKAYNRLNHGALKADLFRYCYLYINGGIYSDIDQTCTKSLDSLIEPDDDYITGLYQSCKSDSVRDIPNQSLIITSKSNPILKNIIKKGVLRILNNKPLRGRFAGKGAGFLGPPALFNSWCKIHRIINKKYNKLRPGKYYIGKFKYNVKPYSLLSARGIAIDKYNGYHEDINSMKLKSWNEVEPINFN